MNQGRGTPKGSPRLCNWGLEPRYLLSKCVAESCTESKGQTQSIMRQNKVSGQESQYCGSDEFCGTVFMTCDH